MSSVGCQYCDLAQSSSGLLQLTAADDLLQHLQSMHMYTCSTLVQALVTSRVDYCKAVLAESPTVTRDRLWGVMNSAACEKFDRGLSQLMHGDLHRLDVIDWVHHKLATLTYRCLHGSAPQSAIWLTFIPVSLVDNIYGLLGNIDWLCHTVVGTPSAIELSPIDMEHSLHDFDCSFDTFKRHLKTCFQSTY